MAETIQLDVSLGLQQAISQAESLRRVLQQSVRPDSSAYRAIEGMLNKVTQQAEMFKQTMGESLKTSSGTKTFTNKLQQTINLLGVAAERLSSVKGKDLIFNDSDLQRIQTLQTQVQQVEEHIKELRKNKVGNFFDDNTVSEFKQIQELAERMHIDISKMTFSELQNAISKELRDANNSIDQTKEKIQQLDNVLKNTNINDINKLTQGLNSKMAGNTIEVFKADNLTEANNRLQAFYREYSAYQGRMRSRITEGDSISKVLENENKAINSNLSRQIAELNNYRQDLEQAFNTLQGISGHKKGQGYDYKREILAQTNMQDIFRSIGFEEALSETGDPAGFITRAREAIRHALEQVDVDQEALANLRSSMLESLKNVFNDLETDKVIGDTKGLKQAMADWLGGEGVDLKNNALMQAFDSIKNKADAAQVVNTFVAALQQYIVTAQQARDTSIQSGAAQETYVQQLTQGSNTVAAAMQAQDAEIDVQRMTMAQLRDLIAQVVAEREQEQVSMVEDNEALKQGTHAYENLTNALKNFNAEQIKSEARAATVGNIRTAITNWMGFNQVMQLTKRAVSEAINHIKQLDTTMNGIAIVTDMTTADLWKQVDAYSDMAQNFGVTIQGAYEVSKIYYQAGYETNDVLTLTNETLKLSKISGLDYATTTDYMMTAMRGFKLEMEDASRVVDVYSNLAANTAVSQQELAEAMTRTASSMESVGATFEETSAMIATMVAVTRESANNIGSAMKSIASRYGELTKDPTALFDAEGEAMSFNKVDEALRSVGITLQTTDHQFRDFTDVILELADKWDTLDSAAQRYVATQFAGNRQQSRFLALVGNVDLLRQNITNAENSEDVGTLQALKALDSLESKLNQVQVAYQQFYTTIGIENVWKGFLDGTKSVIDTLNGLPKVFGVLPINAAAMAYTVISLVKTIVLNGFSSIASSLLQMLENSGKQFVIQSEQIGEEGGTAVKIGFDRGANGIGQSLTSKLKNNAGQITTALGSVGVMLGGLIDKGTKAGRVFAGISTGLGGAVQTIGGIIQGFQFGWAGAILPIISGVINIINGVSIGFESSAEKLERLTKEAENLNNEAKKAKAEYNTLNRSIDKINELKEKRNESIEATEAYHDAVNELAESFPQLIIGFDDAGNAIVNMENAELLLAEARRKTAQATLEATQKEREKNQQEQEGARKSAATNLSKAVAPFLEQLGFNKKAQATYALNNLGMPIENAAREIKTWKNTPTFMNDSRAQLITEYENYIESEATDLQKIFLEIASFDQYDLQYKDNIKKITDFQKQVMQERASGSTEWEFLFEKQANDEFSFWEQMLKDVQNIIPLENIGKNLKQKEINLTLSDQYGEQLNTSLLQQLATNLLVNTGKETFDPQDYSNATEAIVTWWKELEENQTKAEDIFSNLQNYSLDNIYNELNITDTSSEIALAIQAYYNQLGNDVSEQIKNQVENAGDFINAGIYRGSFNSQLGLSLVTEAANLFADYENKGLTNNALELRSAAGEIFSILDVLADDNVEQFVNLQQILHKTGFSTQEQIQSAIDTIQSDIDNETYTGNVAQAATEIITLLNDMQSQMVYNYIAALKASYGSNVEKYKNDQKTLSKLSKGMSIDEVYEFLTSSLNTMLKNSFDINDFQMDSSGNYRLDDDQLEQYWNEYIDKVYAINDDIKIFYESLGGNFDLGKIKNDSDALTKLGFDLSTDTEITDDEIIEAVKIFKESYQKTEEQLYKLQEDAIAQLHITLGKYEDFLDGLTLEEFASKKITRNDTNYRIKKEAQQTLNEAYSNLISDALSKGLENINPDDYTGLISTDVIDTTVNYQEFVDKYVGYTGKTISEVNELIIQAIEKDQEQTRGVQELAKNITFISPDVAYASLDTIQKLADIFQQDVRQMFDVDSYDELLGGYRITNFDFSQIENAQTMVADSIQKFFEDIAKLISNGLAGKLSNQDRDNLTKQMERYGIEVNDAMFTQTAEGLKLSADAATTLYARLRDVDSLHAQLVFDDLADAFQEAGEECENISTTLAAIARLEAELQKPENANNQLLRDRLALYKDIAKSQTSDPNQFKFMDRDLPNGMQGPENYWNAVGKAYTAMNSAKSSGYMEIQDFYNIINEMANLVEMSGGRVEMMGMNFENAAEMSATLIEQGMSALTNIDGKGVKISMAKLGADFGIGVDDMSKGFDDGIKEMARAQIKMLDAQIALLEAVVAMEGLGDINVDNVAGFSFGDVFNVDDNGEYLGGFTEAYSKWANEIIEAAKTNADLAKSLDSVSFNTQTLRDMLEDGVNDLNLTEEQAQTYFSAINSLYEMFKSGEYDLEDLIPSIKRIAAATHFEGEITVGDDKILISHGIILETNETGQYVTAGGKTFDNVADASQYLALMEAGIEENNIITNEQEGIITYQGRVTVGEQEIIVNSSEKGITYHSDKTNRDYSSLDKLIEAEFAADSTKEHNITLEEWKIEQGYTIIPKISEVTNLTSQQIQSLVGKTAADLQAEWDAATTKQQQLTFKASYGFEWVSGTTEEDLEQLKAAQGIESKNVELTLSVNSGNDEEIINLLNSTPATKDIVLTVTDVDYSGLNTDPTNPNTNTPKLNISGTTEGLETIRSIISEITAIDWTNFNNLSDILTTITAQVEKIATAVQTFANQTFTVELNQTGTGTVNIDSTTDTSSIFDLVRALDSAAQGVVSNIQRVIDALSSMETTADGLNKLADALTKITETRAKIGTIATTLSTFSARIDSIRRSLDRVPSGTKNLNIKFNYSTSKSSAKGNVALAKGMQEALAAGTPTLMGELGPELVVSRGHYFVVGQNGAEFVNLDKDAIVFNHKQTKRLLQNGSIGSRGTPYTNETNALSFAKGGLYGPAAKTFEELIANTREKAKTINKTSTSSTTSKTSNSNPISNAFNTLKNAVSSVFSEKITSVKVSPASHTIPLYSYAKGSMRGPAMATASQALAQLKQIRAMWQSMLEASAKELGSLAGGSGGSKKGGGGDDWQQKTTTAEIQRWYNLIRQIARIEEEITYQESLQSKLMSDRIANGKAVYKSYKQELSLLQQEIGANQELAALQKSWYDAKRADLAASDYGKIFTYDENGLQQYVGSGAPGSGLGLDILENLTRQDIYGQAIGNAATAQAQLEYLRSVGFNTDNLRYNEDGTLIKFEELEGEELDNAYVQMMENFWSNLDGWRDELDSIYDSYHEQLEKVLSNQDKQNEIFQKIVDNQLAVESDILEAIESREQKRIDDAQDERDALADSADKFLKGLSDQLNKEREMYQRNNEQDDLNKLRRQLAILQRSGGAASQIRSLQDQINSKTQDAYFTAQQDQIDAIKEASDAQLERLDTQIDLMTETLEYQKENGLLWAEVYEVMARTPSEIQDFITNNTPDFQSNSALQVAEDVRQLKLRIEQWTEYRDDVNSGNDPMAKYANTWDTFYASQKNLFGNIDSGTLARAKSTYEATLAETGDPNAAAQAADRIMNGYRKVNTSDISNYAGSSLPSSDNYNSATNSVVATVAEADKVSTIKSILKEGSKGEDVKKLQKALNKLGYTDNKGNTLDEDGIFGSKTRQVLKKFQSAMEIATDGILGPDTKAKFALKGYKHGGVVDYTGLAMVHGTSARPETFFDDHDTQLLKQDMMMRKQLLPSLLSTYNTLVQNSANRGAVNQTDSLVIQNMELNLNVQELGNDYDARRAANSIMEELMNISRKSGNIGINRR